MKFLLVIMTLGFSTMSLAGTYVRPHTSNHRSVYVNPYVRTEPNSYPTDNYSNPGGYNPNQGRYNEPSMPKTQRLMPGIDPFEHNRSQPQTEGEADED